MFTYTGNVSHSLKASHKPLMVVNMHPGILSNHPGTEVQGNKSYRKASKSNPAPTYPR